MAVTTTPAQEERRVMRALNRMVRSGQPFTVDEIWDRLKDVQPAAHRSWLGNQVRDMHKAGAVRFIEWRETSRSLPHSRPARVWQGTKAA